MSNSSCKSSIEMNAGFVVFLLLAVSGSYGSSNDDGLRRLLPLSLQDEVNMKTPEMIEKYKYPAETHEVITQDDYILTLHRIPYVAKPNQTNHTHKGVVLLMHGILASSADWVVTGPENGLAYILADQGYDVWMGNSRGNRYSRRHSLIDPESTAFWDFSWHEIGLFDIPATIDHILKTTNETQIFFIGHSQGTTAFYVMASSRPEYNAKIRAQISFAPVGYVSHMTSPFMQVLARTSFLIRPIFNWLGVKEFLPNGGTLNRVSLQACGVSEISGALCMNTLFSICGFNYKQLNETLLPLVLAHVPAGSSVKQLVHYAQEIRSGEFRQFDYGIYQNLKLYKSWNPPQYALENITAPVYLFMSKNDWISSYFDVKKLAKRLPNVRGKYMMPDTKWNHLDYQFGIQAPKTLYTKVVSLLENLQE